MGLLVGGVTIEVTEWLLVQTLALFFVCESVEILNYAKNKQNPCIVILSSTPSLKDWWNFTIGVIIEKTRDTKLPYRTTPICTHSRDFSNMVFKLPHKYFLLLYTIQIYHKYLYRNFGLFVTSTNGNMNIY